MQNIHSRLIRRTIAVIAIQLVCSISDEAFSQDTATAPASIRSTELHVGAGIQKLLHLGLRQRISFFMLEGDIGYAVGVDRAVRSITISAGYLPPKTLHNPGLYYTLALSSWAENYASPKQQFTANIAYLAQHSAGLSFLGRVGVVLAHSSHQSIEIPLNVELTIGIAF